MYGTQGKPLEEIEHIFLSPKQPGCVVRRDMRRGVAGAVKAVRRETVPGPVGTFNCQLAVNTTTVWAAWHFWV